MAAVYKTFIDELAAAGDIDEVRINLIALADYNIQTMFCGLLGITNESEISEVIAYNNIVMRKRLDVLAAELWDKENFARLTDSVCEMSLEEAKIVHEYLLRPTDAPISRTVMRLLSNDGLDTFEQWDISRKHLIQILNAYLDYPNEM